MDSFTIAVMVGGGLVVLVLLGLIVIDRDAPEASVKASGRKK